MFPSDAKLDKHPGLVTEKVRTFVYCGPLEADTISAFLAFYGDCDAYHLHRYFASTICGDDPHFLQVHISYNILDSGVHISYNNFEY